MASLSRLLALLMALLVTLPPFAQRPATPDAPTAPAAILVGLRPGVPAPPDGGPPYGAARALTLSAYAALPVAPGAAPLYRLSLAPRADVAAALASLRSDPALAFAEPDQQAVALAAPNDPGYGQQWGLAAIGVEAAWAVSTGSPETVVAVVDAGLDLTHPDLAGRLWTNPGEIAGNGKDDDSNGFVDDLNGWNFIEGNADLTDSTGHGTQVAGVIAAGANNGQGVAGVCPGCRLMVLRVLRSDGTANYSDIAAAVGYAAQKGADVINLSLGGASDSAALRSAVAAAAASSVVVAGAGNGASSAPFYPAAYDQHVLAVAAIGPTNARSPGSNYGPWVDVAAPGEAIETTLAGGGYGPASGTSLGAPFASGVAGLLRSANPGWSPADVRAQIRRTAANIDAANPGFAGQLGAGRLDAGAALTAPAAPALRVAAVIVDGQTGGRPEPGAAAAVAVSLANDGATLEGATATLSGSGVRQGGAELGAVPALGAATTTPAFTIAVDRGAGYNTRLSFTLRVVGAGGFSANLPVTVTTSPGVTDVPSIITTQTWTADRLYRVSGDVGIPTGQTLTIQPGTVVRFAPGARLRVLGALVADGTAERPITFASQDPSRTWEGIVFEGSSQDASFGPGWSYLGGSILRYVAVENGTVMVNDAAPFIAQSSFGLADQSAFTLATGGLSANLGASSAVVGNSFNRVGLSVTAPMTGEVLIADNRLVNAQLGSGSNGAAVEVRGNRIDNRGDTALGMPGMSFPSMSLGGPMTVTNNVVVGGGGISVAQHGTGFIATSTVSGNLVVGSTGPGLTVSPSQSSMGVTQTVSVRANTLVDNAVALQLSAHSMFGQVGPVEIRDNNFVIPPGSVGISLTSDFTYPVEAAGNYWGGVSSPAAPNAIFDKVEDFDLGEVAYDPPLAAPAAAAPAFVEGVAVDPDTIGIQTGTFTVRYSRPMDTSTTPQLRVEDARRGTTRTFEGPRGLAGGWYDFDSKGALWMLGYQKLYRFADGAWRQHEIPAELNPNNMLGGLAIAPDDSLWISAGSGLLRYDGQSWERFAPSPSSTACLPPAPCQPSYSFSSIAVAPDGAVWSASIYPLPEGPETTLARFDDGAWSLYKASSSTFPRGMLSSQLLVDRSGVAWMIGNTVGDAAGAQVVSFDGTAWRTHTLRPRGDTNIPAMLVSLALDPDGVLWALVGKDLATYAAAAGQWRYILNPDTMGMSHGGGLAIDAEGTKWLHMTSRLVSYDGEAWNSYTLSGGGTMSSSSIVVDPDGHKWYYSGDPTTPTLTVFYDGYGAPVPTGQWLDERTFQARLDVTALVSRGPKRLAVTGAHGSDGVPAADSRGATFTVDYAGQVSDRTAPAKPYVFASGVAGEAGRVRISYAASDAESAVDQVRYAIGSGPGAVDIVGWTSAPVSAGAPGPAAVSAVLETSRSGLGLTGGATYYVALQARNPGGLWSPVAVSSFVSGQVTNPRGYIVALSPGRLPPGSGFTLTVRGYGFMSGSVVLWNGSPRPTIFVSATELRATIGAADIASAGAASVAVRNPAPGGGDSDPATFTVGGRAAVYLPLVVKQ